MHPYKSSNNQFVPGKLAVGFKDGTTAEQAKSTVENTNGCSMESYMPIGRTALVDVPVGSEVAIADLFRANKLVDWVEQRREIVLH